MSILRTSSFNPKYSDFIVRADGRGTHQTITAAITAASELDGPQTVLIGPGVYTEDLVLKYNVSLVSLSTPTTTTNYGEGAGDLIPDTAETIIKGNHIVEYSTNPHIITLKNIRFESNNVGVPIIYFHNLDVYPAEEVYGSVFKFKNCTLSQFEVGAPTNYEVIYCPAATMFGGLQCELEECTIFMATPSMFILESATGGSRHSNSFTFKNSMFFNAVEGGQSNFDIADSSLTLIGCNFYTTSLFSIDSTNSDCNLRIEDSKIVGYGEVFRDNSEGAGQTNITAISSYFINRDVEGIDTPIFAALNKEMFVRLVDCTIENRPSYLTGGLAIQEIANTQNTSATYTGDITFEGVRILGSGTGSGDGLERGTIELVPDVDLYSISPNSGYGDAGQYLIIDPTAPSHIHIRAGGPIDEAAAILILGGEKANVTVRDQDNSYNEDHHVSINTFDNDTTSYNWTFNNDGRISLPTKTMPGYSASYTLNGSTLQLGASGSETIITGPTPNSVTPTAERFIIQGQQGYGTGEGGDVYLWAGCGNDDLADPLTEGGPGGDAKVRGGYSYGIADAGYVNIKGGWAQGSGAGGDISIEGGRAQGEGAGGDVDIQGGYANLSGDGGRVWIKGANSNTGIGGDVELEAGTGGTAGAIKITNGGYTWTFDNDKKLNFPGFQNSQSFNKANGNLTIATATSGTAWTGSLYHSTVKLIIQAEYLVEGIYQVQSCEVLLVRSSGTVVNHVTYGNVYTHDPLFTVTSSVDGDPFDTVLEVNNLTAGNLYISTFATTLGSRD